MNILLHKKYENLFRDIPEIRYVIISGGRGSGKSFATSLFLASKFYDSMFNCIYLRETLTNCDISVIPQFLDQISILNIQNSFHIKHGEIENKNGMKLFFKGFRTSSNDADAQLKSIPHLETVLIEEATEVAEKDFDRLDLSIRDKDSHPKIILTLNPSSEKHWIYKRFFKDSNVEYNFNGIKDNILYIHTTYLDNYANLDESFIYAAETAKQTNQIKYHNLFLGEWLKDNYNSLWTEKMIELAHSEISLSDDYDEIVIGVDPAVTTNKNSDETGIIVAARRNDEYYILEEKTGKWTPLEWARIVNDLYQSWNANAVVVETNQGGDLCEENLRNVNPAILIEKVRASKGKIVRAEPIAGLYQAGKVHHIKHFEQLEYEMQTFSGDPKDKSPNSLDAMVWAMHYLSESSIQDCSGF